MRTLELSLRRLNLIPQILSPKTCLILITILYSIIIEMKFCGGGGGRGEWAQLLSVCPGSNSYSNACSIYGYFFCQFIFPLPIFIKLISLSQNIVTYWSFVGPDCIQDIILSISCRCNKLPAVITCLAACCLMTGDTIFH